MNPALRVVLVLAAAALGVAIRHRVNRFGHDWLGTLCVNVAGSFVLGFVLGSDPGHDARLVVGTGLCGGLTTFSTFALEATEGRRAARLRVIGASLVLGLSAAWAGFALG